MICKFFFIICYISTVSVCLCICLSVCIWPSLYILGRLCIPTVPVLRSLSLYVRCFTWTFSFSRKTFSFRRRSQYASFLWISRTVLREMAFPFAISRKEMFVSIKLMITYLFFASIFSSVFQFSCKTLFSSHQTNWRPRINDQIDPEWDEFFGSRDNLR